MGEVLFNQSKQEVEIDPNFSNWKIYPNFAISSNTLVAGRSEEEVARA